MCARADRADSQSGLSVEEGSIALHLHIETAALSGCELLKRLHCDIKPTARAPLMPDPGNGSIDEEYRVVSRLPTGVSVRCAASPGKSSSRGWLGRHRAAQWTRRQRITPERARHTAFSRYLLVGWPVRERQAPGERVCWQSPASTIGTSPRFLILSSRSLRALFCIVAGDRGSRRHRCLAVE